MVHLTRRKLCAVCVQAAVHGGRVCVWTGRQAGEQASSCCTRTYFIPMVRRVLQYCNTSFAEYCNTRVPAADTADGAREGRLLADDVCKPRSSKGTRDVNCFLAHLAHHCSSPLVALCFFTPDPEVLARPVPELPPVRLSSAVVLQGGCPLCGNKEAVGSSGASIVRRVRQYDFARRGCRHLFTRRCCWQR